MDIFSNIFSDDVFGHNCVTSPNPSDILKSPHLSLDDVKTQAINKGPLTMLSENVESSQYVLTTNTVAEANHNRRLNFSKDLVKQL